MADVSSAPAEPKKSGKGALIAGLVLALVLGGGGFYAVYAGYLLGGEPREAHADAEKEVKSLAPVNFVPIEPLHVSLGQGAIGQHLRFEGHLEVEPAYSDEVQKMMPRIMDVMNSYLRAVELNDLGDPGALVRLRSQMLRRIQVVTGDGRVRDLLVTKFLIS